MAGILFPIAPLALFVALICAGTYWRSEAKAARVYAVLCGGALGAVIGASLPELWCWFDRGCWSSLGDGMGEGMVLLVYSAAGAIGGWLVGLVPGWAVRRSLAGRRLLFVAVPVGLAASVLLPMWLAW